MESNLSILPMKKEVPKDYIGKIFTNTKELMEHIKYLYKNNE